MYFIIRSKCMFCFTLNMFWRAVWFCCKPVGTGQMLVSACFRPSLLKLCQLALSLSCKCSEIVQKKQTRNPKQSTSRVKQWKFQLVGGCDWQVRAICGGGGSSQSSVTEHDSSYGKAKFPLRLEISVCKAPGSPYLPKHIETWDLSFFLLVFTLKMIHECVGVLWLAGAL